MDGRRWTWRPTLVLLALLLVSTLTHANAVLHDLNIQVVLSKNGDARITEVRKMSIDSEGTECYIVIGNLNGSEIRDLEVTDETGAKYKNVGSWDVSKSRDAKRIRCGIVEKSKGCEICWGLGDSGERTYTVSYTVTNLLRAYPDADGFNYMFVANKLSPSPKHVRLTIEPEWTENGIKKAAASDTTRLSPENTGVWAFRFRGDINVVEGVIVAESSEPFISESAMIVMTRFDKGVFAPSRNGEGTFEQLKDRAFEGSDYLIEEDKMSTMDILKLIGTIILFVLLPIFALGFYIYYVWKSRKKVNENLLWYRGIPNNGNLEWANNVLNAYKYFQTDYNNLLAANVLKLVQIGAVSIEKGLNHKGKPIQFFVIRNLPNPQQQTSLMRQIHSIFYMAAGDDSVLEPWELKKWMKKSANQGVTDKFINTLHTKSHIRDYKHQFEEVRQLIGLKKYLKEFSLLDERHVQEVWLWKDYMIYATLFGIADQVIKDMKQINPQFFKMDQVAETMADTMTLPTIYSTFSSSTRRAANDKLQRERRASGGGGSSSWGGGGGFSGGGSGGGVR
ncbi:MAG: DUF2207 domain-containing protein [Prevotella sp.]|nr:DUF2207 domain-containing protein [Prevotella sp.]